MHYFTSPACYDPAVGFSPKGYSAVIDWGYTTAPGFGVDLCLQAMLVNALAACVELATAAGDAPGAGRFKSLLSSHTALVRKLIGLTSRSVDEDAPTEHTDDDNEDSFVEVCDDDDDESSAWVMVSDVQFDPSKLGFHAAALLLGAVGVFGPADAAEALATTSFVKTQLFAMFPNDSSAPRLSDPSKVSFVCPAQ